MDGFPVAMAGCAVLATSPHNAVSGISTSTCMHECECYRNSCLDRDAAYWPEADIPTLLLNVCFYFDSDQKSDIATVRRSPGRTVAKSRFMVANGGEPDMRSKR
jgi:hypothetical protein